MISGKQNIFTTSKVLLYAITIFVMVTTENFNSIQLQEKIAFAIRNKRVLGPSIPKPAISREASQRKFPPSIKRFNFSYQN